MSHEVIIAQTKTICNRRGVFLKKILPDITDVPEFNIVYFSPASKKLLG